MKKTVFLFAIMSKIAVSQVSTQSTMNITDTLGYVRSVKLEEVRIAFQDSLIVSDSAYLSKAVGNLDVSHLNGGIGADTTTFWRGDGTWSTPAVTAPASTSLTINSTPIGSGTANGVLFSDISGNTLAASNELRFFKFSQLGQSELTVGATSKARIVGDYSGSGEIPAGTFWSSSVNSGLSFAPSTGSNTYKLVLGYYNGAAWKSALEYANTTGSNSTSVYLVKGGGTVLNGGNLIMGNSAVSSTPSSGDILAQGGSGANINGAALNLSGGYSTGSGSPGDVVLSTGANGTTGSTLNNTKNDRYVATGKSTSLSEGVATQFLTVNIPAGVSNGGVIHYSIKANDATDFQCYSGTLIWDAVNKAGVITYVITDIPNAVAATSAGTLFNIMTAIDAGSGVLSLRSNATSSLTQTSLKINIQHFKN